MLLSKALGRGHVRENRRYSVGRNTEVLEISKELKYFDDEFVDA